MAKAKYFGKDQESRTRQLANLNRRGRSQPRRPKTKFLDDERNLDVRYFLQHHFYLENKKPMVLEPFQIQILDALYPKIGNSRFDQAMGWLDSQIREEYPYFWTGNLASLFC